MQKSQTTTQNKKMRFHSDTYLKIFENLLKKNIVNDTYRMELMVEQAAYQLREYFYWKQSRQKIGLSLMKKPSHLQKNKKKSSVTTQNSTWNLDYTTIAIELRTVSWSNDSH